MEEQGAQQAGEVTAQREAFRTRLFLLMLEIAGIFLVPALIAVALGRWLDRAYDFGTAGIIASLAAAFVFSWVMVALRYRRAMREGRRLAANKSGDR